MELWIIEYKHEKCSEDCYTPCSVVGVGWHRLLEGTRSIWSSTRKMRPVGFNKAFDRMMRFYLKFHDTRYRMVSLKTGTMLPAELMGNPNPILYDFGDENN